MTELVPAVEDADVPVAGSTVSLLSTTRNIVVLAELDSWSASPSGLVVTIHMTTTPEMAQMLDGQRTWASAYTQHTNTLVVFEGGEPDATGTALGLDAGRGQPDRS